MSALTVWKFDDPNGADHGLQTLEGLAKQELIKVHDGAIVSWPPGKNKPKTSDLHSTTGIGALGGPFGVCCRPAQSPAPVMRTHPGDPTVRR